MGSATSNPAPEVPPAEWGMLASSLRMQLLPLSARLLGSCASGSHSSTAESESGKRNKGGKSQVLPLHFHCILAGKLQTSLHP